MDHTPGPWEYDGASSITSKSEWLIEPSEDEDEAGVPLKVIDLTGAMGGTNSKADAYLIAAAPELLEVLQLIAEHAEPQPLGESYAPLDSSWIQEIAKAAIRKATLYGGGG